MQDHVCPLPSPQTFHFCPPAGFLYGHLICFTQEGDNETVQPQEIAPLRCVPVKYLQPGGLELILQISPDVTCVEIIHGEKIKCNK